MIYGPVRSRRFGYSLGMNLLPTNSKICTFNCIYCECGWNPENTKQNVFADKAMFLQELQETLASIQSTLQPLDVLTYAGNGEPTLHPDFLSIAQEVAKLRDKYVSGKKIILLTNGTTIFRNEIQQALEYIDIPVFKIDSANNETVKLVNQPYAGFNLEQYIDTLSRLNRPIALQTMLLKGFVNNEWIDNTSNEEVQALIDVYKRIRPIYVMLYSLDRKPPLSSLQKIDTTVIESIAKQIEQSDIRVLWV
jgi:wyosine [tRNA(Phe)-imidazoG37] synthetase (radical SAM superfamily)